MLGTEPGILWEQCAFLITDPSLQPLLKLQMPWRLCDLQGIRYLNHLQLSAQTSKLEKCQEKGKLMQMRPLAWFRSQIWNSFLAVLLANTYHTALYKAEAGGMFFLIFWIFQPSQLSIHLTGQTRQTPHMFPCFKQPGHLKDLSWKVWALHAVRSLSPGARLSSSFATGVILMLCGTLTSMEVL